MERLVVILAYAATLWLILSPPSALRTDEPDSPPFWRNVRFWASVVVAAQITVYALWG